MGSNDGSSFATPPAASLRRRMHQRSSSDLAGAARTSPFSLNLSVSGNGRASLEKKWDTRPTPVSPFSNSTASASFARAPLPSSASLPSTSTGSSGRPWPHNNNNARSLPLRLSPPPSQETTTPPEAELLSPPFVAVPEFRGREEVDEEAMMEDAPVSESELGSPDIAKVLLRQFTVASPSPARKRVRRTQSLSILPSTAGPLGDAIGEKVNRNVSHLAPRSPPPVLKFASSSSRVLSTGRGALAMKASTARTKTRPFAPAGSNPPRAGPIRITAVPPLPSSSANASGPPANASDALRSLTTLLASAPLLPNGWIPTLDRLIAEGESALEGSTRGPSRIASLLRLGEEAERDALIKKAEEKPIGKKRSRSTAGQTEAVAASIRGIVPAVAHPPFSGSLTWIHETGMGPGDDEE
ncbi:hypothetical protein RQP46_006539 [Phenoliferia psychrophenolica]